MVCHLRLYFDDLQAYYWVYCTFGLMVKCVLMFNEAVFHIWPFMPLNSNIHRIIFIDFYVLIWNCVFVWLAPRPTYKLITSFFSFCYDWIKEAIFHCRVCLNRISDDITFIQRILHKVFYIYNSVLLHFPVLFHGHLIVCNNHIHTHTKLNEWWYATSTKLANRKFKWQLKWQIAFNMQGNKPYTIYLGSCTLAQDVLRICTHFNKCKFVKELLIIRVCVFIV